MSLAIGWAGVTEPSFALSERECEAWHRLPAHQQPSWGDEWLAAQVKHDLARLPALFGVDEIQALHAELAEVAAGRRQVIQVGDCAEDPETCTPSALTRRVGLVDALAGAMRVGSGLPVVRVGRIAGQFAKPRSAPTEVVAGVELPVFRGHLVNSPEATPEARRHDPLRLLGCYEAAASAVAYLRKPGNTGGGPMWTSHEALVLDYELPQLRRGVDGELALTSTHWPWVGERTRQPGGAHISLLSAVSNPVACKVGPDASEDDVSQLCALLDPLRRPGRLTLIVRMGAGRAAERLPALAARVRAQSHPVIWLCDPMHGNTVRVGGRKTRLLPAINQEIQEFRAALAGLGIAPGGLHLEATPDPVTECLADESESSRWDDGTRFLCDPRMNADQALVTVAESWR